MSKVRASVDRSRSLGSAGTLNSFGVQTPPAQVQPDPVEPVPEAVVRTEPTPAPIERAPATPRAAAADSAVKVPRVNHNYRFIEPVSLKFQDYFADWSTKSRRLRRLRRQPSETQFIQALLIFAIDYLEQHPEEADRLESLLPSEGRTRRRGR